MNELVYKGTKPPMIQTQYKENEMAFGKRLKLLVLILFYNELMWYVTYYLNDVTMKF